MKKHDKKFLHETDDYTETALWKIETIESDAVDVVFKLSDGKNEFEIWEFITDMGSYDDVMQKIISIEVALEELKQAIKDARNIVQFRE